MISTILQYSTNEFRFLEANLRQSSKFSDEIIIPICTHFFNGNPENKELLEKSLDVISKFSNAKINFFNYDGEKENVSFYHNLSRKIGTDLARNEWLLFLDIDEIMEDEFYQWYEKFKYDNVAWIFTCHWYFREPIYRAVQKEAAGLLVNKKDCNWNLNERKERQQLYDFLIKEDRICNALDGPSSNLLLHHYSWVRSKETMLSKVKTWGHKNEKSWSELVEEEFSREFNGTDFVHGYDYEIVDNKFNI